MDTEYEGAGKLCERVQELRALAKRRPVPYERVTCSEQIGESLSKLSSLAADLKSLSLGSSDKEGKGDEEPASPAARQLATELMTIGKLSYRGKNQHRHSMHFHKLREAQRRTKMLLGDCAPHITLAPWVSAAQQAETIMRSAGATTIGQLRKVGIPSARDTRYALDQLECLLHLAACVKSACEKVTESAEIELLGQSYFMPFSLITIAASSRIWAFIKYVERLLTEATETLKELVKTSGIKEKGLPVPSQAQTAKAQPSKDRMSSNNKGGKPKQKEGGSAVNDIFATLLGGTSGTSKRKKNGSEQQQPPKKAQRK